MDRSSDKHLVLNESDDLVRLLRHKRGNVSNPLRDGL